MPSDHHANSPAPLHPQEPGAVIPTRQARRWIEPWYIAYAILGALVSGVAVILVPIIIVDNGGTATQIGTAIAMQNFGMLFAPFWGWLSDRFKDYRTVFFGGFILLSAGFALFALVQGPLAWHLAAFLIGFGAGASNTVAGLFVVEFTPQEEWSQRISWLQTFNAIGVILGTACAGQLRPRLGLAVSAFLAIPALVIGGWGLPVPGGKTQHRLKRVRFGQMANLAQQIEPMASSVMERFHQFGPKDMKAVARTLATPFGALLSGWFLFSLAVASFSSLYPVLMRAEFHLGIRHSSLLLSAATALSLPFYNLAGRWTASHGPVRVLSAGVAVRSVALAAIGLLGIFRVPFGVLPAMLLFAVFQGIWPQISVASNNLAASLAPFGKGAAMGLFNASAAVASGMGAIAGGAMADRFGYSSASLLAAVVLAFAFICTSRLNVPGEQKTAQGQ